MKNDIIELPKMSLVSLLRWLAVLELIIGLAVTIAIAAVFGAGMGVVAFLFIGFRSVVFIAVLLYAVSFLMPSVEDLKTFMGMPIQKLLRYSIYIIITLGILEAIFNIIASALVSANFVPYIFAGLLSMATAAILFLSMHLLLDSKKTPKTEETKTTATKTKSSSGSIDWVDSLLKDVDKTDTP